ncbi:MAG TPA: amino acid adenylation domain-containing protein [Herpetosiphonaceae bacterium]
MSDLSQRISGLSPEKRALLELRLKQQGSALNTFPLSFAQERLWFLDQLEPGSASYSIPALVRLRGSLDAAALESALNQIVERHEALRTTFTTSEGRPVQVVAPALALELPLIDLRDQPESARESVAMSMVQAEIERPFDLQHGPLLRARLLRLDAEEHLLLLTMHHIVSDGWSMGVLIRELVASYHAHVADQPLQVPPLQLQYADYAVWQRKRLQGQLLDQQLGYWRQQLGGAPFGSGTPAPPLLELPTDRPRPPVKTSHGAIYAWSLPQPLTAALLALSQREGTTLFQTLLAAFQVLLARYSGQDDIVVGSPIHGRSRPELEDLIGFFVNTLALRTRLADNPSFRTLIGRVREMTLQAFLNQDLPFERLVEALQPERDLRYTPLFQVVFALQNAPIPAIEVPGLTISPVAVASQTARFDLALTLAETEQGMSGRFEYNTDLFHAATIEALARHFHTLLAGIVADPDRRIADLPLLTEAERERLLVEWNATQTPSRPDQSIMALFEAQAARTPDAVALISGTERVTYAELNRRANRLAHYLRAQGIGPERRVGVCLDRSPELIVAILAILKAGGAYLPLDPAYPAARLAFMIEDAQVALLLTRRASVTAAWSALPDPPPVVDLEVVGPAIAQASNANPGGLLSLDQLAYVIYTSGSTGVPKGVLVSHRGLNNLAAAQIAAFGLRPDSRVLQFASPSFDAAVSEIVTTLLAGAALYLAADLLPGSDLLRLLRDESITTVTLPPSLLAALPDATLPKLETIVAAGESCPAEVVRRWQPGRRFLNAYGPTEYTVCATIGVPGNEPGIPPIGRPIANTRVYLLDRHMQPVPVGVVGELYLGGPGIARGYLDRPDLTAECFVPDPFADQPGGRLYKTGDLARYRPDGQIVFVGRHDEQLKVRGFRVEPGEIEAALRSHPAVREAIVLAGEDTPEQTRLVAYVVPSAAQAGGVGVPPTTSTPSPASAGEGGRGGEGLNSELRAYLKERLPDYMVPSAFVFLDALPLSPNGKIDRRALSALSSAQPSHVPRVAPQTELEHTIAAIWQELLQAEAVGREDNFFEIGGHSLLMVQVQHKLSAALGRDIAMVDLFRYPTISALARFLSDGEQAAAGQRGSQARAERRRALLHGVAQPANDQQARRSDSAIAIIGMAGRFPGAQDIDTFWQNLCNGVESIAFFSDQELLDAGVEPSMLALPNYVKAGATLDDIELFDADFFGYSPREAEIMDPQQRLFLECAWAALEHAGYAPDSIAAPTGVFAGVSLNRYWMNLFSNPEAVEALGGFHTVMSNDRDFLTTRISYKLNLRGPSINVQTACSTSLVAVHMACQSLLHHECDMALAGGVSVAVPAKSGYLFHEGGINAPDGHCRAFDAEARGTISGSGMGIVILKRLQDALDDGDQIYAVIRGSAINNDGAQKVGYTAPSVDGQAEVLAEALAVAGVAPDTVSYVEAHGTATALGDPIEVAALTQAFRGGTDRTGFCAIGSVKTNVGHLDAAAGVTGLIKAALALKHGQIPPSLHFERPNPQIDFASSPFYVNNRLVEWPSDSQPRRAGVSSFGIGGTNAHVVLEEAPAAESSDAGRPWHLLTISAKTEAALEAATTNLAAYLRQHPAANLSDVAYTLQTGRSTFDHRRALVCRDVDSAVAALESRDPQTVLTDQQSAKARPVVFMFPGGGGQHAQMARELYETEPVFRSWVDRSADLLSPQLGLDIRAVLFPAPDQAAAAERQLQQTALALPALFAIEYALAQLWISWGIQPAAMIGHSLGEYVAACLAGVFSLEDALTLVTVRGRLMQQLPAGMMLSVALPEAELRTRLESEDTGRLSIAAVNAPALCVVSGPAQVVAELERALQSEQVDCRRVPIEVAAHSTLVEPMLEEFGRHVQALRLNRPQIPCISGVTGTWLSPADATDPAYWVRHLRQTVRFADGIAELLTDPDRMLLEVGPGRALSGVARLQAPPDRGLTTLASLPGHRDQQSDDAFLLTTLGRLWLAGAQVDWRAFYSHQRRRRVALPTYPFQRQRYWIERQRMEPGGQMRHAALRKKPELADWFYVPSWRRTALPQPFDLREAVDRQGRWLVFVDTTGFGAAVVRQMRQAGQAVVAVQAADRFSRLDQHDYAVDPRQPEDYVELLSDLRAHGFDLDRIVHLWSVAPAESFEQAQASGFYSLIYLAQALEQQRAADPLELVVVLSGAQAVTGEEQLEPEKATVLGPARIVAQEYPHITCRTIDIALPAAGPRREQLARLLLAELSAGSADFAIAYRGGYRWAQTFEPMQTGEAEAGRPRLRENGVYLITGGLGYVGLTIADELARSVRARLVLVSRSALPDRSLWEYWLTSNPETDAVSTKIRAVQLLESHGAMVLTLSADVADAAQMHSVMERIRDEFGTLHGVIHAAGVTGEQAFRGIHALGSVESAWQFQPKVYGLQVLEAVLAEQELDFCLLCSSLASILGGLGFSAYAAANLFMDAFAHRHNQEHAVPWISVNWEGWRAPAHQGHRLSLGADLAELAITPQEGAAIFRRIITLAPTAQIVVSTNDLSARIEHWSGRSARQDAPEQTEEQTVLHERRNIPTPYTAPTSELEGNIAQIWERLLGIAPVGIHDNFFDLGGHSLLAVQLVSRLRSEYQVDVSLHTVFESPTVAQIAALIDASPAQSDEAETLEEMLQMVEQLSEDEITNLLLGGPQE